MQRLPSPERRPRGPVGWPEEAEEPSSDSREQDEEPGVKLHEDEGSVVESINLTEEFGGAVNWEEL